jgi:hypothetical protein
VHRKKDATEWGVDPQIVVPMDAAAESRLLKDRYEQELFRRPVAKAMTRPATVPARNGPTTLAAPTTAPATQPVLDVQLQRAVDTMTALVVLEGDRVATTARPTAAPVPPIAMTVTPGPSSQPVTQPDAPDSNVPDTSAVPPATQPATKP